MKKRTKTLTEMFGLIECPHLGEEAPPVTETVTPALTDDEKAVLRDALEMYRDGAQTLATSGDTPAIETLKVVEGLYEKLGLK